MKRLSLLVLCATFLAAPASAQYSDYDWAIKLSRIYGFDDMAEKVLLDTIEDPKADTTEKLRARLGLAELKASQGRRASDVMEQLARFEEARSLMQKVLDEWKDRGTQAYFDAIFTYVDLLQEKGERTMKALNDGKVSEDKTEELRKQASADFGRAEAELGKIMTSIGEVDPEQNREKWRQKNRAWYTMCLLLYNQALTHKKDGSAWHLTLGKAADQLEEFILANEGGDEEALLGAYYGYLLKGRVHAAKGDLDEAEGFFTSVLDQDLWDQKLHPLVQALVERTYFHLLEFLNDTGKFDKAVRYGTEMEAHFKKLGMEYQAFGRAARVKLAEALLRQGDMNTALGIAAQVVEVAGDDGAGFLANQLISEIIAATPDKTQFAPEIVRSAARGAFSQPEKRSDAIKYLQILLQLLDKVADENERKFLAAESWYIIGSAYYNDERYLAAAQAFEEGARNFHQMERDGLGSKLVRLWEQSLQYAERQVSSAEVQRLLVACRDWQLQFGAADDPGAILTGRARKAEDEAEQLERGDKLSEAIGRYEEAARLYAEAVTKGGPNRERAMISGARIGLKVAKLHLKGKREAQAVPLLEKAKADFRSYIATAIDPANKLTDPRQISAREQSIAVAKYSIADVNGLLAQHAKDAARKQELLQGVLEVLAGFESDHRGQQSLVTFAVYERLRAKLELGDAKGAESDYRLLKQLAPDHDLTRISALSVGKALKPDAEKRLKEVVGEARSWEFEEWEAVRKKPEFKAAYAEWLHVCDLYREWLESSGSDKFSDWDAIIFMYWSAGAWEQSGDLLAKAFERFGDTSKTSPEDLAKLQHRALVAWSRLARAAAEAGDADRAGRLWHDAGRVADALINGESKFGKTMPVVRMAAFVYGGYVGRKEGVITYFPALGQYEKAVDLWGRIEKSLGSADPAEWEAKFYHLHSLWRLRQQARETVADIRKNLESLKAVTPELGGDPWKDYFNWLDFQVR